MKHIFVKNIAVVLLTVTLLNVKAQTIFVESKDNVIVLQVSPDKYLNMVYFGEKLSDKKEYNNIAKTYHLDQNPNGYNSAYTSSGTRNLLEPAISVIHADGNRSLDLHYVSHTVAKINDDVSLLSIVLSDSLYDFQVTLNYKTYYNDNVTEQWSVIEHHEKKM